MRKTALALLLAASAGVVQAQEGTKWIGLQGAYITQDGKWRGIEIKDRFAAGLAAGAWLTDRWGLEGSFLTTELKSDNRSPQLKGDETHGFVSGLFNLNPGENTFYPYLRAGLGMSRLDEPWSQKNDSTTRMQYHAGIGVQGFFAEHLFTNLEARAVHVASHNDRTELMAIAGIGYRWGGASQTAALPPPPPPAVVEEAPPVAATPPPPPPPPVVEAPPVVVAPPPPPPPPPTKIVLEEAVLHFANGKAVLSQQGVEAVQKVAAELQNYSGNYTLVVSGHTSSTGSKAVNKALSKRRADAVAKVLMDSGIPAASIETVGAGPDQPIASNKSRAGQAKNRRVEIEVKVEDGTVEKRMIETEVQDGASSN